MTVKGNLVNVVGGVSNILIKFGLAVGGLSNGLCVFGLSKFWFGNRISRSILRSVRGRRVARLGFSFLINYQWEEIG